MCTREFSRGRRTSFPFLPASARRCASIAAAAVFSALLHHARNLAVASVAMAVGRSRVAGLVPPGPVISKTVRKSAPLNMGAGIPASPMLPAVCGVVFIQPYREHAQVCDEACPMKTSSISTRCTSPRRVFCWRSALSTNLRCCAWQAFGPTRASAAALTWWCLPSWRSSWESRWRPRCS